ncbi:MAG: phytoene desaturase, partial [Actinobacteria bacterium]|nr:phytoene desaturase [Actinomycetota bacterium]
MVRRVKGPTDHVVIVGAGLAGLSAALRLAGAGRKVTVVERESVPGGRNGLLNKSGYSFDTGPSVLTMPDLIADAFASVGENMSDWLELSPLRPIYRAFYADGSQLDVHANTAEMEVEIAKTIGSEEAAGYRKYVDFVTKLYKYEMNDFIDRNIDSPLNLLTPNLARLIALGGFRKLAPKVSQFLKDPRTQKIYSFQAMYAGVSPQQALAIYAVIAYMDSVNGVFFPKGGMHAVPRALA